MKASFGPKCRHNGQLFIQNTGFISLQNLNPQVFGEDKFNAREEKVD